MNTILGRRFNWIINNKKKIEKKSEKKNIGTFIIKNV